VIIVIIISEIRAHVLVLCLGMWNWWQLNCWC